MPTIYRYTPHIEPGPNGRTIRHTDTEDGDVTYLCQMDGVTYVSVPDGVALPDQPAEITLEAVSPTPQVVSDLRRAARPLAVSKAAARDRVRSVAGDVEDQVADLEKRLGMAERLLYRMAVHLLRGEAMPQELVDDNLAALERYLSAVDAGQAQARSDLEDRDDLVERLLARSTAVSEAVAPHVELTRALLP